MKTFIAAIAILFSASQAMAIDCETIRLAVKQYGKEKVIQAAKDAGASKKVIKDTEIQCLKDK